VSGRDLRLELDWGGGEEAGFRLEADTLSLAAGQARLTGVRVRCEEGSVGNDHLACARGFVDYALGDQRTAAAPIRFVWKGGADPELDVTTSALGLAGGRIGLEARLQGGRWQFRLQASAVDAARLNELVGGPAGVPEGLTLKGTIALDLRARGIGPALDQGEWTLEYRRLGFADADQAYLGEGLAGIFAGALDADSTGWRGHWSHQLTAGELLTPALYLSAAEAPLETEADVAIDAGLQSLAVTAGRLSQGDLIRADYALDADLGAEPGIARLGIQVSPTAAGPLYRGFLQPALGGDLAADLDLGGRLSLDLDYRRDGPRQFRAGLEGLTLSLAGESASGGPAFGIDGITGEVRWSDGGQPEISRLGWRRGYLFGTLDIGASTLALKAQGQQVELAQPASIPLLDGELRIDRFAYGFEDLDSPRLAFDGLLTPVSLGRFARAVHWPELSGKISGMIPGVSLDGGTLAVDGVILVSAFDGRLLIRDLRLTDPFGAWPVLTANLELHALDLEQLTGTFAFGRITGRLEGRVSGLRLENWRPVAFDARLQTPPDDDSRHRISQRAIENISKLGGSGAAGVVSRGFLSVFEDFGYKRLGIGCRLSRGVCEMDGVAPADNGYYLVQGAGVPRVDVKGFNRRIDWNRLVNELAGIQDRGAPTIE
jgi:hypothetical protein